MRDEERDAEQRRAAVRVNVALGEAQSDLVQLAATVGALVELLVERGVLDGAQVHARVEAATRAVAAARASRVRPVRLLEADKAATPNAPVDCAARMPLCRGACCALEVTLATADVEEGALKWDLGRPYLLRHDGDGRCAHQDRATGVCGAYDARPAPCRSYSCAGDRRIWRDFERRLVNEKGVAAMLARRDERPLQLVQLRPTLPPPTRLSTP